MKNVAVDSIRQWATESNKRIAVAQQIMVNLENKFTIEMNQQRDVIAREREILDGINKILERLDEQA